MALQHTRLLFPSTVSIDRGGSNSASDQYHIFDDNGDGVTRQQALTYSAAGYPVLGSVHPEIANLFAKRVSFIAAGRAQLATWAYEPSAGGAIDRPPVDMLAGNFLSLEISSTTKMVELPTIKLMRSSLQGGDPPVDKYYWEADENAYGVEVNIHTFTAVLSGEFNEGLSLPAFFSAFAGVRAQENTLHTFNGDKYLFKPRYIKQRTVSVPADPPSGQQGEPAKWEIQYTWEYDPGIRNTLGPNGTPGATQDGWNLRAFVSLPPVGLFTAAILCQDSTFALRPYQNVRMYPDLLEPDQPPVVDFVSVYRSNPSGWQTLPGFG